MVRTKWHYHPIGRDASDEQYRADAQLEAQRFTGVARDAFCEQYQVWVGGELIGWRDHKYEARAAVREAVR